MNTVVLIIGIVLYYISTLLNKIPFLPPPFGIALLVSQKILPVISYIFIAWGLWRLVTSFSKFTQVQENKEE